MNVLVLSGDLGSGKSTVAKIILPKINAKYFSTGQIMRNMAKERGIPFVEFSRYAEADPTVDYQIDEATVKLCKDSTETLLIDSRMAWHFVPEAFSVYMMVSTKAAAQRIMDANRSEEMYANLDEAIAKITDRRRSEKLRYSELYNVKLDDLNNYDYVLDTTNLTPEQVADKIIAAFNRYKEDGVKRIEICPTYIEVKQRTGDKIIISGHQDAYYTLSGGSLLEKAIKNGESAIECEYVYASEN